MPRKSTWHREVIQTTEATPPLTNTSKKNRPQHKRLEINSDRPGKRVPLLMWLQTLANPMPKKSTSFGNYNTNRGRKQ